MASGSAQETLNSLLDSADTLLTDFHRIVGAISRATRISPEDQTLEHTTADDQNLDPLALARDSVSLVKAHSTKISLLIINKPFTATAVTRVIRELIAGPVPALVVAAQKCDDSKYTILFRRELAWQCARILKEVKDLLAKVPRDGNVIAEDKRTGASLGEGSQGVGSITATGLLWSACDGVVKLVNGGVAGFLTNKVGELKDTVKDIMDELKEWGEDEGDDGDGDDGEDGNNNHNNNGNGAAGGHHDSDEESEQGGDAQDMIDRLMDMHKTIPRNDPDKIRERLERTLKRLRIVLLLFRAAGQRRFKTLPSSMEQASPGLAAQIGETVEELSKIPNTLGDIAEAFYELSKEDIESLTEEWVAEVVAASDLLKKPWVGEGDRDGFTDWIEKFQDEIVKM